jgi:branched-subunit amino acid transport protein AzlD
MSDRVIYLLGVVAVGWAVTFSLRALPFLLMGGAKRELSPRIAKAGDVISPVIIAALIAYSYAGLEWKTAWPYLAGVLTVGLQLWKRNPLVSIVAGTVVYMCLLNCGCTTTSGTITLDAARPSIRYSASGFLIGNSYVEPQKIVRTLKDYEVPRDRVIHIQIDDGMERDLKPARAFMSMLAQAGYTRSVLVTKKRADSTVVSERELEERKLQNRSQTPYRAPSGGTRIRYKRGDE